MLSLFNRLFTQSVPEPAPVALPAAPLPAAPVIQPRYTNEELFRHFWHCELNVEPAHFPDKKIYLVTDQDIDPPALKDAVRLQSTLGLTAAEIGQGVFYIYFLCDSDALPEIRNIQTNGGIFVPPLNFQKTSYRFIDRLALNAIAKTGKQNDRISHFVLLIHENICEALALTRELEGAYIEIGVYKGGSALTALNYIDEQRAAGALTVDRPVWLFDTFDGFAYEEAERSQDAIWSSTHRLFGVDETIVYLKETFANVKCPYQIMQSNICTDSLPDDIGKIAVANIDVDMYEPTLAALEKVSPHVIPGGIIICEDPASTPGLYGALLAMEQFLETREGSHYIKMFKGGQYFLIRHS